MPCRKPSSEVSDRRSVRATWPVGTGRRRVTPNNGPDFRRGRLSLRSIPFVQAVNGVAVLAQELDSPSHLVRDALARRLGLAPQLEVACRRAAR